MHQAQSCPAFCSIKELLSPRLLACAVHARLPTRARVWLQRLGLRAIFWINRIVEPSIALIRRAWRKAFIVTGATIDPAIILTRILTAILATILPRDKTILWASILSSVLLRDRRSQA
jgi:hypothetical protein